MYDMEEGTRNTIIGAVGLGLALSYGLPKLLPLGTRPKTIQEGKLLSAHPTISEIDPDFPQINIRIHNIPLDHSKFGLRFYDTIPFQMISQFRSGKAGNSRTGNAHRPTSEELEDMVRRTKRIQILSGALQNNGGVASNKPHWQKTANGLREQGLLSQNNIEQMAHAPFDWSDLGLEILIDMPVSSKGTGTPLRIGRDDNPMLKTATIEENPFLDIRMHPKLAKVNLAKWDMVSKMLQAGRHPDGDGFTIMLTDDDLFRCYIDTWGRSSTSQATVYNMDEYMEAFAHEPFRPATMSNFKKAPAVVHRYNAKAVFLMPYEFNEDSTYANVYNTAFNRGGLNSWKKPSTGYPEAYNQNEN